MFDLLLVGTGGFLGANARYILSTLFARRFGVAFPYGTIFINTTGSFLLGLVFGLVSRSILVDPAYRWLVGIGFCGGYTTFSTYSYETLILIREKKWAAGIGLNFFGSYILGMFGGAAGFWLSFIF